MDEDDLGGVGQGLKSGVDRVLASFAAWSPEDCLGKEREERLDRIALLSVAVYDYECVDLLARVKGVDRVANNGATIEGEEDLVLRLAAHASAGSSGEQYC